MRELHVYVNASGAPAEREVFYSRRADGPLYRWRYEEAHGRWRFSRVHRSRLTFRALCLANWRAVPTTLQASLGEHYLE